MICHISGGVELIEKSLGLFPQIVGVNLGSLDVFPLVFWVQTAQFALPIF
jgi:hypothetical protein